MLPSYFVYLGVAAQFFGGIPYFIDTLKGKVKPNKVSWFLWTLAPMIAFFAMLNKGTGLEMFTTFIVGFVPLIILIASFFNKEADWKLTTLDYICGAASLGGLVLWYITKEPNVAIVFSILADGLAAVPTMVKAYKEPETEESSIFFFGIVNAAFGLLVLTEWKFANYGFNLYLFFLSFALWILTNQKIRKMISKS